MNKKYTKSIKNNVVPLFYFNYNILEGAREGRTRPGNKGRGYAPDRRPDLILISNTAFEVEDFLSDDNDKSLNELTNFYKVILKIIKINLQLLQLIMT